MPKAISALRHPRLESTATVWKSIRRFIDLNDDTQILDYPNPPTKEQVASYGLTLEQPAIGAVRALVLNSGLRAFAKSLEANEGALLCAARGASASGLLLQYDAAYLAARAFCLLLGFAPVNRESTVTVDVLRSFQGKVADPTEDNFSFFIYGRWGHSNIWELTSRLIRTLNRREDIEANLRFLRSDKLEDVSNQRNQQIYGTGRLYAGDFAEEADFPDLLCSEAPVQRVMSRRYYEIFRNISAISRTLIKGADLGGVCASIASEKRQALAA